jgi:hypothetical protein
MNTLTRLPTRDPLMRAYRLSGVTSGRPITIHEIVRRHMAQLGGSASGERSGQVTGQVTATR